MQNILFFVKFGKREHLQQIIDSEVYFSNSKTLIDLEDKQQKRGQGDLYEGKLLFPFIHAEMRDITTNKTFAIEDSEIILSFFGIDTMPVFCLTAGYKNDCEYLSTYNQYKIKFNQKKESIIRRDFEKADSALIILTPDIFIQDVAKSFKNNCKAEIIRYFDMSILTEDRVKFLFDSNHNKNLQNQPDTINQENLYRILLCKDSFFENQQEFRFISTLDKIDMPKIFNIKMNSKFQLTDIDSFFSGVEVSF